jgi:hypothetical protein
VTAAARIMGCHRNHVYRLRARLAEHGSLKLSQRRTRTPTTYRDAVIGMALADPALGPKKISAALRSREMDPIKMAHGTVSSILRSAGLGTVAARRAASAGCQLPEPPV